MAGLKKKLEHGFNGEEEMRMLFGEELGNSGEDGFEGSKEEQQIFKEVFYGTHADDACYSHDLSRTSNQTDKGSHLKVSLNCESSVLTSYCSMKDSSGEAFGHTKMNSRETGEFEYFQESSSSWGGSCAHNLNVMRTKLSPIKHLDREKKETEHSDLYISSDLNQSSKVDTIVPMKESLHEPLPCRIIETLGQGILSSYYLFNQQGEMDGTGGMDDGTFLNYKCRVQNLGDVKIVIEPKSVTSPVSQESVASGLLATGAPDIHTTPKELPGALTCMEQNAEDCIDLNTVDAASKRVFIKDLLNRLHSHAHRLLIDAGWKIEPRKRIDRDKLASNFINPEGGPLIKSLSGAWKACGRLLAAASNSEEDDYGRAWVDIDGFWGDLTDILAHIGKGTHHQESSLSLLHQWQLLDPFIAVVWINKKIGVLRAGKALKAVKSATFILGVSNNMILGDNGVDRVDSNLAGFKSCSIGSLHRSILPVSEPDNHSVAIKGSCNQEALDRQDFHLQRRHRCGRGDRKFGCCGELHKRSLKSLARRIGKGLHDVKCSHDTSCKGFPSQQKKPKRPSSKHAFMQKDSHLAYSDPNCKMPMGNERCDGTTISRHMQDLFACESASDAVRGVNIQSEMHSAAYQASFLRGVTAYGTDNDSTCGLDLTVHQEFSPVPQEDPSVSEKMLRFEASISELKGLTAAKTVNNSTKKGRKKSKKISEIEATEVSEKTMKAKSHDGKCREAFNFSMNDRIDDKLDLPSYQEEADILRSELTSECLEKVQHLEKPRGNIQRALEIEEAHISVVPEATSPARTHNKPVKSETKAARQCCKNKAKIIMPLVDEPGITLSEGDECQDDIAHHISITKRECFAKMLSSNESTSMSSNKRKKTCKSKKVQHQPIDPEAIVLAADNDDIPMESHSEKNNDEVPVPPICVPPDHRNSQIGVKANRSEVHKQNGRKRPRSRINDDDLLIAAIIKSKDTGSCGKHFALKVGVSQSKTLKKLKSRKGSCKLLPRTPGKGGKHSMDGKRFILGARTVLCWLIEMGAISPKDVLQYRNPKNNAVIKDGWVTRDGILCKCCSQIFSVSDFKAHAGFKQQKPSLNLFLQSGKPYTLCQLQAWSAEYKARKGRMQVMEVEEVDQNDDTCGLCGDGGKLICCDNCPSTYHQTCLPVQDLPEGSWYCFNCICEICGDVVSMKEASGVLFVSECSQCEHKYHERCIKEKVICNAEMGSRTWFCGEVCQKVYLGMRSRVGLVNFIDDGFSWSILRCSHDDQKVCSAQKIALMAECNTKLAIALTLMEECFLPMVDPRTGIDMIPHVLYNWGSNFARLNYQGFYAVVLEKDDVLISVASIRVHGVTVAEMPLIATCSEHRRQGMCRRLINAIEKMLISLKVKMLVLSAIPSLVDTWISGFGFKPIEDEEKQQLHKINLMLFPGTTLLKKNLFDASAKESGKYIDSCSRNEHVQTFEGFLERANTETAQQYTENARLDMDAESMFPGSKNLPVEQVNHQQRDLLVSCENSVLTARLSEHGDVSNTELFNVKMGISNNYEIDQIFSTDHVAGCESVANVSTVSHSCYCFSNPTATNELPSEPSSSSTQVIIRDMAVDISKTANERIISFEGDECEQKSIVDSSEGKNDICFPGEQTEQGTCLETPNLNEINMGKINKCEVSGDDSSSTPTDEVSGFVGRHPVSKGCTTGSVEA